MKVYTTKNFNRDLCKILAEAELECVKITRRGKRAIILTVEDEVTTLNEVTTSEVTTLVENVNEVTTSSCDSSSLAQSDKMARAREALRLAEGKVGLSSEFTSTPWAGAKEEVFVGDPVVDQIFEEKRWTWSEGEQIEVTIGQWVKSGKSRESFYKLPKQPGA